MTPTLIKSPQAPRLNAPTVRRLANGLTIVAEQLPIEAVNLNLWLNVGSAIETDAINGMAHFLEHMVFKGTAQLASGEFERLIEERGAVTNAATSQDYTHYYITTAPKDFAELAPLQMDVVLNAEIADEAFERERSVILEEIRRSDDNPRRRTFAKAMEVAFEKLPYRRPVLGPSSVIEQLTPQQMRDFHTQHYQPHSMTAAVVGNLPVEELIQIVETSLAQVQAHRPAIAAQSSLHDLPSYSLEPAFDRIVRQEVVDDSLQQARLVMAWRAPGLADLQETYALDILATILGQGRTARLIRDLREEKGLVTSIAASNITFEMQGAFYISAQLPAENIPVVEAAIAEHIRRIQTEPVTEAEIARVRTQVANRFIFGNETPSDRASLYGYYQAMVGDLAPALNYPAHIQALDAVSLQASAQRYLSTDAYGVVVLKPAA
ncbi:insulinase family protein [Trichocoleus sp. FACHB-591]|uniref:M16 family metallopeptidase n=1 Tax=Trichocoleus sp. FACHB-591 TaxID=2692872 RepID=UPI001687EDAC|nr:pitrilysin family protein [Trichocoleus sp. FACHB-591]MBD2097887.1 insulinase family protein [Trichocoleus sp. FACHB-591]